MAKLLGVDVGTSSTKVVLINEDGFFLGMATCDHPTYSPISEYREQNPEEWWKGVCSSIHNVIEISGIQVSEIAAISFSGQGGSCVPVSNTGELLGRAIIWTDGRASQERSEIPQIFGSELGRMAGNDIYDQPAPRMMWIRNHLPEIYRHTAKFLSTVAYLIYRSTGVVAGNTFDFGFWLGFNRSSNQWNHSFLSAIGLDSSKFPDLLTPYEIVGTITETAARDTGLLARTPVVAGGLDTSTAALAAGIRQEGQAFFIRGSTDLLCLCSEAFEYHPGLYTTCAVSPHRYLRLDMKQVVASGGSYQWLANLIFNKADDDVYRKMDELAAGSKSKGRVPLFLPYLFPGITGDVDVQRTGAFFGLTTLTNPGDLCRAVMEGTGFAFRESIDRLTQIGYAIKEITANGGQTNSVLWNQITADITHLPFTVPNVTAGAAYGAAILAGIGVGLFSPEDPFASQPSILKSGQCYKGNIDTGRVYNQKYPQFQLLAAGAIGAYSR